MPKNAKRQTQRAATIPGIGERSARLGYGAQDRLAADLVLQALKEPSFASVRLADLAGGKVDDFVLVWDHKVSGNSVKWTGTDHTLNWGDLCGAGDPLIHQLAQGWRGLKARWPGRAVEVFLRTNKVPSAGTHGNQLIPDISLASFFRDEWSLGYLPGRTSHSQKAWEMLLSKSELTAVEFAEFVGACHFLTGTEAPFENPSTHDAEQWQREFDRLKNAINDRVELEPDTEDFTASDIRKTIGAITSRMPQRFPQPEIGYEENESTAQRVRQALASHQSGYIALTGPAGAGKSTLASVLIQEEPFAIPYFAFLPNGQGDPRERGDALAFYRHLISVLDQWGSVRKSHGVADLAQAREALHAHVAEAHRRFVDHGHVTLILIDGLDHVTREEGLDKPLQLELPLPEELLPGCVILLSTQPQALLQLRPQIRRQLEEASRKVDFQPLPPEAVFRRLAESVVGRALDDEEKRSIMESCAGNPLILTYIVKVLRHDLGRSVKILLDGFGQFNGDIRDYYSERFYHILDDPSAKRLLGLICRVRGRIPIFWVQQWTEWGEFERLFNQAIAAFFHSEGGCLTFVHNSLVAYLLDATLPSVPGSDRKLAERSLFQELADRCPEGAPVAGLSRDRLFYQVMGADHARVLEAATSEWFRDGANAFVPAQELLQILRVCYRSAFALKDYGAVLRFAVLSKEIERRDSVAGGAQLASFFLNVGEPSRAFEQVADGVNLRVKLDEALRFSSSLALFAESRGDSDFMTKARRLFDLTKPVNLLFSSEPLDFQDNQEHSNHIRAWAEAVPYFLPIEEVISQILGIKSRPHDNLSPDDLRAILLLDVLTIIHGRSLEVESATIVAAVNQLNDPHWNFVAKLRRLRFLQSHRISEAECLELTNSLPSEGLSERQSLEVSERLCDGGLYEQAKLLVEGLAPLSPTPYPDGRTQELAPFSSRVKLARLRAIVGLPLLPVIPPDNPEYEGAARVAVAASDLGQLLGIAFRGGPVPTDLENRFSQLLHFKTRTAFFSTLGRFQYHLAGARPEVYETILTVASAFGLEAKQSLKSAVLAENARRSEAIGDPGRRQLAMGLYRLRVLSSDEATSMIAGATEDASGHETQGRTEACLEIAEAFYELGNDVLFGEWLARAGFSAHGVGSEKDYQMATWADWLERSISEEPASVMLPVVALFVRLLQVAGGSGGSDAAESVLRSIFRRHPVVGCKLGLEMIEKGILNFGDALSAILEEAALAGATTRVTGPIYSRLLTLSSLSGRERLSRDLIRSAGSPEEKIELANKCVHAVRVNCQLEHRLFYIRGIREGLLESGIDIPDLYTGLPAAKDDHSALGDIYKNQDGTLLTVAEVTALLSDMSREADWNNNPSENERFRWSEALDRVKVRSSSHLRMLETKLAPHWHYGAECYSSLGRTAYNLQDFELADHYSELAVDAARDGGWIRMHDGAPKRQVYERLISVDPARWSERAAKDFETDFLQNRVPGYGFVTELDDIFDALKWPWPAQPVRELLATYLSGMSRPEDLPADYVCLTTHSDLWTPEEALGWFLTQLLGHPVSKIGSAARLALADGIESGVRGFVRPFEAIVEGETVVMEQALMALEVGTCGIPGRGTPFRAFVERGLRSPGAAVRVLAERICSNLQWPVAVLERIPVPIVYNFHFPESFVSRTERGANAAETPGAPLGLALDMYEPELRLVAKYSAFSYSAVLSRARQFYTAQEKSYEWLRSGGEKLKKCRDQMPVLRYIRPEAVVARDSVLRVIGELKQSHRLPPDFYGDYDEIAPTYDSALERLWPCERPSIVEAISDDWLSFRPERWCADYSESDLLLSPTRLNGQIVLAERSLFRRPQWEQPKEFRISFPVPNDVPLSRLHNPEDMPGELHGRTRQDYGRMPTKLRDDVLVASNSSLELTTPASEWLAFNCGVALNLGWSLSQDGIFRWVDSRGSIMVESIWWRDGWTDLKPPRYSTLGEGWLVVCSPEAFDLIREAAPTVRSVLYGQRSFLHDSRDRERERKSVVTERPFG